MLKTASAEPLAFRSQSAPEPPKPSPAARILPSVCTARASMKLAVTPGVNPLSNEPSGLKRVMAPLDCPPAEGPAPTRIFLSGWTAIVLNSNPAPGLNESGTAMLTVMLATELVMLAKASLTMTEYFPAFEPCALVKLREALVAPKTG